MFEFRILGKRSDNQIATPWLVSRDARNMLYHSMFRVRPTNPDRTNQESRSGFVLGLRSPSATSNNDTASVLEFHSPVGKLWH